MRTPPRATRLSWLLSAGGGSRRRAGRCKQIPHDFAPLDQPLAVLANPAVEVQPRAANDELVCVIFREEGEAGACVRDITANTDPDVAEKIGILPHGLPGRGRSEEHTSELQSQ